MEEKPDLEMVVLAVSTLYTNPDRKEKERASEWLLSLQKSVSIIISNLSISTCLQVA